MPKTTAKAVEAWDLSEMLAVLCQIAQDAGDAESSPRVVENVYAAGDLPATDEGASRS